MTLTDQFVYDEDYLVVADDPGGSWTGQYEANSVSFVYPVVAGDVSSGTVTFRLFGKTSTAANKTLYANGNQEFVWSALVVG